MRFLVKSLIIIFLIILTQTSYSQIVAPTGISTRSSSQLIYIYDNTSVEPPMDSWIQVTNRNENTGVWIHVQIFRNFDPDVEQSADSGAITNGPLEPIICDERNFVDFLTPNDSHTYELFDENFHKNIGESEGEEGSGELASIDVSETKGFVVITPVVSESDLTAISFQHLFGTSHRDFFTTVNAMGRDAVNFSTGETEPDGTPLDGVTNGFVVLQPEELLFDFAFDINQTVADVIGISFKDNYGPPGLLGYQINPGENTWTSFIFDFKEDPTSCGDHNINCYSTIGLNDSMGQFNDFLNAGSEILLCSGSSSLVQPDTQLKWASGWVRIFVSGLDNFENHFGYFTTVQFPFGTKPMFAKGERTEISPEAEDEVCDDDIDNDGDGFTDCEDTDCTTNEACETGTEECTDGTDNDEDGATDCADLGCDGTVIDSESGAVCETGGEASCNDGFDNDGDGAVDGADSDCQVADTGDGDGGGGGGCAVTGKVTAATAAVNFLLPLLPFASVYGYRRWRSRK